ncbi:hypothetical protein BD408DRAFT_412605 [Parasitella parasitica]|nr:hypothetical protein BD408DRAFT_412605 [Parasitella parasitica]
MKLALVLLLAIYCILASAIPDTVSQNGIAESGPFTNKVSGSGSSAQTFSQSTTEYTTQDGRTIRTNDVTNQYVTKDQLKEEISRQLTLVSSRKRRLSY